ncbi:helix-turn-helix domain-containing protein [Burkholderia sp. Bp9012]|uniref:helix-turn-helix domain-containing protein n=1 Tax=Burkholderia sp. Bp9012 TaxID=2184562 RepID=UPI000F5A0D74|nr:helix-turn-helix domain-containing protein [Burkholderia sp. Bp9012]RQR79123.1 helix-turn-helix domain-containing protein [Burkholderia sp. Bp9012]
MTSEPSRPPIERFATSDAPHDEQFEAWAVEVPFFDFAPSENARRSFDMHCQHVSFGPFVLENRVWKDGPTAATFAAERTLRHARADHHDYYCFNLQVGGSLSLSTPSISQLKQTGDLYLLDYGRPFEYVTTSGHEISLAVPRALLPPKVERLHGHSLSQGAVALLRDHLLSLRQNVPELSATELPYIADATTQLLLACVQSTPDGLPESHRIVDDLLARRVRHYIDTHLLETDLTPDRICLEAGISRAKLYQLFTASGGVMREIRQRRLHLAHQVLSSGQGRYEKIRTIARRFGFADEKYFSRIFRARYGYAPSEAFDRAQHK